MKHIIKITEEQHRQLFEAANEQFSLEELSNINSFKGRYDYCARNIGKPQGRGSGRVVFQMDDEKVLKLALNQKGIAQNSEEHDSGADECDLAPKVFDNDVEYRWLVSEYVLPAKPNDFKQCLGVDWKTFVSFLDNAFFDFLGRKYPFTYNKLPDEQYENMVCDAEENESPLYDWYYYVANYQPSYGDMRKISSYGMTMRNGTPTIVLLDSGLSDEVWNKYYRGY